MSRTPTAKTRRQYGERMALHTHNAAKQNRTDLRMKQAKNISILVFFFLFVAAALWFGTGHN